MGEQSLDVPSSLTRRAALTVSAGAGLSFLAGAKDAAALVTQGGWYYCDKCRGVFRSPKRKAAGACPAGGKHRPSTIGYLMYTYDGAPPAGMWSPLAECRKCTSLFIIGNVAPTSGCPAGGAHTAGNNPRFVMWGGTPVPIIMDGAWDYCGSCKAVFNKAGGRAGVCSIRVNGHDEGNNQMSLVVQY